MVEHIREYRILTKLGEGGMGSVYLAEDPMLERKVAIKVLNPVLTKDAQFVDRFRQEARVQATLIHPNIVSLYTFFHDSDLYYMVLEYAQGQTLRAVIEQQGALSEDYVLRLLSQILAGLGYAHAKGVVHRDIKPANIMVGPDDTVKILDFGIAKMLGEKGITQTGAKLGTICYMSPEQVQAAKNIDGRTDIYSVGITLFEMLTGRVPFAEDMESEYEVMREIVRTEVPDPRTFRSSISRRTAEVLLQAVKKNREERPATAQEFGTRLHLWEGEPSGITIVAESEGHEVVVDGVRTGQRIPCRLESLSAGRHVIAIDSDTHWCKAQSITITGQQDAATVTLEIQGYGFLRVKTAYGSLVLTEESVRVRAGETVKLPPGMHVLAPSLEYLPSVKLSLVPAQETLLDFDALVPRCALHLKTDGPSAHAVLLNHDTMEEQQLKLKGQGSVSVLPGRYAIRVEQEGISIVHQAMLKGKHQEINLVPMLAEARRKRSSRRRGAFVAGTVLFVALVAAVWYQSTKQERTWEAVRAANVPEQYSVYLREYPSGKYASDARRLQEDGIWSRLRASNTEGDYIRYLSDFPNGRYKQEAVQARERLMWQRVRQQDVPLSYQSYVDQFPSGTHVADARGLKDEAQWQEALRQNTEDAYLEYLRQQPQGRYTLNAESRRKRFETLRQRQMAPPERYFAVSGVASNDVLYIRQEPNFESSMAGTIPPDGRCVKFLGQKVKVKKNYWLYIEYSGTKGWVNSYFLREDQCR